MLETLHGLGFYKMSQNLSGAFDFLPIFLLFFYWEGRGRMLCLVSRYLEEGGGSRLCSLVVGSIFKS